ncbi:DUF4392 domain-containing protein [Bacillus subtilis]|uniref:D-glutamate cyclase-like C-terminal domain-containing protein n=1 Tax=Bacillus subtilis subsp. subtilis TaxID=135461 RepID=A0ABD3ZXE4_BACIU|nr:glutamate cyclase domain-containing protein [Bacillus subtilis]KIL32851.1 hypothetical protein B4067_4704 [Bacillus subtilis subsp. subtilis]KIN57462.1 hypothetical protein B4145_4594 [Bacillus subtilis]
MYEQIDQLVNIDYNNRSIDRLYVEARKNTQQPLTLKAAHMIEAIPKNRFVFFATGALARGWVSKKIGETDGPLGTAALARAIRESRDAIPVIFIEESLINTVKPILRAAGLCVVTLEEALSANNQAEKGYTSIACVLPFPSDEKSAKLKVEFLIEELKPAAVICIEKTGMNTCGVYHNMKGHDYSEGYAKIDFLIQKARNLGIPTIGIGDGGNEIGMASVHEAIRKYVPYGGECQCGCGGGISSSTETDLLITGSVSNWACYAVCASLAIKTRNLNLLHTVERERLMLKAAVAAGNVDGVNGMASTSVDGFSEDTNLAIVELLSALVNKELS